jgi:AI-2 transport protein TqsA
MLTSTFSEVLSQQAQLTNQFDDKLQTLYSLINQRWNLNLDSEFSPFNFIMEQVDFTSLAKGAASSIGSFGSSFFLFTLYYVFLLIGVSDYRIYLTYVAGGNKRLLESFETIQGSIATYISIKSIISLVTAFIVFLVCTIFGVNFAIFWGFLAFFLNFIPNIGSIISTLLVMLMAFVQFEGYSTFIIISILLTSNQLIIGNFVDPIVMGNRLRLNTVTVIFGLVFWGYIWDIPGMLLSVPLMVAIKLILGESESMGILARIIGYPERIPKRRRRVLFKRRNKDEGK